MLVAEAIGLSKEYDGRSVVNDVSFGISEGEVVVLVGPNGSGKTTTMEMLVGLRRPTAGRARIGGVAVAPGGEHRSLVGVQLQQSGLPNRIKVGEALQSAASLYAHPADLHQLLADVGLADAWRTSVDRLSGGQQRRLDVALACVGKPPFLVLDEPTSGLDPQGRAELWEMLRQIARESRGILTSTHDLNEAEAFADRIILIRDGRLVFTGSVEAARSTAGGDWRLRVLDAPEEVLVILRDQGLAPTRSGTTAVVVSTRAAVERARSVLLDEIAGPAPECIAGPVRLEDVFLFAGRGDDSI